MKPSVKGGKTDTLFVTSENFRLRLVIGHKVFFSLVRKIVRPIRLRVFCKGSFLFDIILEYKSQYTYNKFFLLHENNQRDWAQALKEPIEIKMKQPLPVYISRITSLSVLASMCCCLRWPNAFTSYRCNLYQLSRAGLMLADKTMSSIFFHVLEDQNIQRTVSMLMEQVQIVNSLVLR